MLVDDDDQRQLDQKTSVLIDGQRPAAQIGELKRQLAAKTAKLEETYAKVAEISKIAEGYKASVLEWKQMARNLEQQNIVLSDEIDMGKKDKEKLEEFYDGVARIFGCSICYDAAPCVLLNCGHRLCKDCFHGSELFVNPCSFCRQPVTTAHIDLRDGDVGEVDKLMMEIKKCKSCKLYACIC